MHNACTARAGFGFGSDRFVGPSRSPADSRPSMLAVQSVPSQLPSTGSTASRSPAASSLRPRSAGLPARRNIESTTSANASSLAIRRATSPYRPAGKYFRKPQEALLREYIPGKTSFPCKLKEFLASKTHPDTFLPAPGVPTFRPIAGGVNTAADLVGRQRLEIAFSWSAVSSLTECTAFQASF